jgi:hypothetical protein
LRGMLLVRIFVGTRHCGNESFDVGHGFLLGIVFDPG